MAIWAWITKKESKNNFFLLKQLTVHKRHTNNSFLKQLKIYHKFLSSFQQMADQNSMLFVYLINSHSEEPRAEAFSCLSMGRVPGTVY